LAWLGSATGLGGFAFGLDCLIFWLGLALLLIWFRLASIGLSLLGF
jgi:hypothetical protein